MISSHQIADAEYIIDNSNAVDILIAGYRTERRGRPPARNEIRLMLIGLFLSIAHRGRGTFAGALEVLLNGIPLEEAVRLGVKEVITTDEGTVVRNLITINTFYNPQRSIDKGLSYGPNAPGELDYAERQRRHRVLRSLCDSICDVFNFGLDITAAAADATSLEAWARPCKKKAKPGDSDDDADFDDALLLDVEAATGRRDLDADHGHRTRTINAATNLFYGYHQHALVAIAGVGKAADSVPALALRVAITAANADVVDITLDMIDSLENPIRDLAVDRLYHYKDLHRWKYPLNERGIRQHNDLNPNEQGFTEAGRLRWAAGSAHCPATPDDLGTITRPSPRASHEENVEFSKRIKRRNAFALVVHGPPDIHGTQRLKCPAEEGGVGCRHRSGSIEYAIENNREIVENPPDPATDGEPLPKCCTQQTVTITPPPSQLKLQQPNYWGSDKWEEVYDKRTRVEGFFGNIKNPSTENVRRGHLQKNGLVWIHIIAALSAASYNLRIARNWNERRKPSERLDHPLLTPHPDDVLGYTTVTRSNAEAILAALATDASEPVLAAVSA